MIINPPKNNPQIPHLKPSLLILLIPSLKTYSVVSKAKSRSKPKNPHPLRLSTQDEHNTRIDDDSSKSKTQKRPIKMMFLPYLLRETRN